MEPATRRQVHHVALLRHTNVNNSVQTVSLFELPAAQDKPGRVGRVAVQYSPVREILTCATGFMDAYDFTLNPYAGCSFGCTYCYAAFFSHSPKKRDSWGQWVTVKENAVERLRASRRSLDGKLIYMSSVTDPYQPIERKLRLTRGILEMLAGGHRLKLVVQTRSPDVVRDVDLFHRIVTNGGHVQVNLTVTTDDEDVRRTFEPHCPNNGVRLRAASELRASGVRTCITMTPLLLVEDADGFADSLLATGVEQFIVQPFHFQRGRFLAGTRDAALCLMAEKLASPSATFRQAYLEHYERVRDILRHRLPNLGEGKDGFRPPF